MLQTERLLLRPFRPDDLPLYARVNADPEVMRFLGGPLSREASDAQALGANHSLAAKGFGKVAVERVADGAFLGMCGLSLEPWYPDELEIGWRLDPAHWHYGYATEAARAWLGYAFETLGTGRVISICDLPNRASIAVAQRLGMTFDHEAELAEEGGTFAAAIYSMRRDQYASRNGLNYAAEPP